MRAPMTPDARQEALDRMVTERRATVIARDLFPDAFHDGADCRAEYGREGQPCRICAEQRAAWLECVANVRRAVQDAFR